MKKAIVLIALILAVIVAGCVGKEAQTPPEPTGDASAVESGATDIGTGISDLDTTSSELDAGISDADLDVGL